MAKPKRRYNPKSFPLAVREKIEIDYASKLSPEQQDWLAAFNEAEYGGKVNLLEEVTGRPPTKKEKRKLNRQTYIMKTDALAQRSQKKEECEKIDKNPAFSKEKDTKSAEHSLDDYYLRRVYPEMRNQEDVLIDILDKAGTCKKKS